MTFPSRNSYKKEKERKRKGVERENELFIRRHVGD
jgi:hypothetical protein